MAPPLDAAFADVLPVPTRVSVVGLGHMGTAIAERMLAGSYHVHVFNRSAGRDAALIERGALRLPSLDAALAETDVCLTSLTGDEAVESAVFGERAILSGARAGTVLIEMSTVSVAASARVAVAAAEHDVHYLDVDLVLSLADSSEAALPLTHELRSLFESACEHGHADSDFVSLLLELKGRSAGIGTQRRTGDPE